jgi:hypothetical protein
MRLVMASRHGQSSRLPPPPMAFVWSCCLRWKLSDATAAGWLCALRCSASPPPLARCCDCDIVQPGYCG